MGREGFIARRRHLDFTQESLAHCLNVATATVSKWENGSRCPAPGTRRALAEALEVSLVDLDRLLGIEPPPISLNGHLVPTWLNTYQSLVLEAGRFEMVVRSVIPAVLQTRAYATGVERCVPGLTDSEVEERVRVRLERQQVLERTPNPLQVVAVLHQGMFGDVVGGPDIMVDQCDYLLTLAERPNVEILLLPADGRATYCPGEFELLIKQGEVEPFMGITIDPGGADYHERDVADLAAMFAYVLSIALSPEESAHRIESIRETYR
jgi:transcriptional regulator with XRE-family HTH domain